MLKNRIPEKSLIRRIAELAAPGSINMGLGEIQYPVDARVKQIMQDVCSADHYFYTPNQGLPELRNAIAGYYDNLVQTEQICVTNGSAEAIFTTLYSLIDPSDTVAIMDPGYPAYKTIITMLGGGCQVLTLTPPAFSIDIEKLQELLLAKPKALIFSNPSNPTGCTLSLQEMKTLSDFCLENDILLIVDEIYKDLYLNEKLPSFIKLSDKHIIISGVSKSLCLSGIRLGWVVAPIELNRSFTNTHQYLTTCASVVSQRTAQKILETDYWQIVEDTRQKLILAETMVKEQLTQCIPNVEFSHNQAAPYIFFRTDLVDDDITFCQDLAKLGLVIIPGAAFGKSGTGWLRLNYGIAHDLLESGLIKLTENIIKQ